MRCMTYTPQFLRPTTPQSSMPELEIPGLQILNEIGQGGMAKVYLAMQESLQRPVAVKLLNNPDTPGFHGRFLNEGRYLAALSHSNIVEVYDVGECHGRYYILMEYLPGGDLKRRIQRGIKPATALKLTVRIASCLDYLHSQGIVHRDLKPSNILFRADNKPVLTDFGIAKLLQDTGELTMGGSILGSPAYLSPEQAGFSDEIDGRSDLYSLGVILYEMLTGRRPFTGENFAAIIMAHHQAPIPLLPEHLIRFQPVIERLLAKRADDRFQTGAELIQALRMGPIAEIHQLRHQSDIEITHNQEPSAPALETLPPHPPPGRCKRGILVLSLLLVTGLLPVFSLNQSELGALSDTRVAGQTALQTKPQARQAAQVMPKLSKVDQLLILAYKRMDSLQLSYPQGDSALRYFHDILALEPDNMAAQAGMRQIVRWYIRKAEESLDQGNSEQARRYIYRGRMINREHPKLVALQRRSESSKPLKSSAYQSLQLQE